jgi:hypothetical protein
MKGFGQKRCLIRQEKAEKGRINGQESALSEYKESSRFSYIVY